MRTALLCLLAVMFVVLAPGCPTVPPCSAATCSGCCDATAGCQAGNSNLACGASGAQCSLCQGATSCTFGVCGGAGAGGNTGGGSGSGGGTGGSGGGTANPTVTQFCIDATNAQADHYAACGEYSAAGTADQRARQIARCNSGVSAAYTAGRATFDPTVATAAAQPRATRARANCSATSPPA